MSVCTSDQPYSLDISPRNECLVIDCPGEAIPYESLLGKTISGGHLRVLYDFAHSLFQQPWTTKPSAEEEQYLLDALYSLLRGCTLGVSQRSEATPPKGERISESELHRLVVEFIDAHLHDSSLRTSVIAARLSLSETAVQRSFSRFGSTPSAYMQSRRLQIACERMHDPSFDGTLTDLAHELGFSDSAHFSRKFKAHFAETPSSYRRRAVASGR